MATDNHDKDPLDPHTLGEVRDWLSQRLDSQAAMIAAHGHTIDALRNALDAVTAAHQQILTKGPFDAVVAEVMDDEDEDDEAAEDDGPLWDALILDVEEAFSRLQTVMAAQVHVAALCHQLQTDLYTFSARLMALAPAKDDDT